MPERAWEPNDLSREVEYVDTSRGGNRSLLACLREQRPVSRGVAQPAGSINHECLKDALGPFNGVSRETPAARAAVIRGRDYGWSPHAFRRKARNGENIAVRSEKSLRETVDY